MEENATDEWNESCHVYWEVFSDPANHVASCIFFAIAYSLIFVFGLGGNAAVVAATLRNQSLQTAQNIYIINLAVADMVVSLLSVPVTPMLTVYKQWFFGRALCHLIPWVQGLSLFVSSLSLTAIAADRYVLIIHPTCNRPDARQTSAIALLIWLVSAALPIPYGYHMRLRRYAHICGVFCDEQWASQSARRAFTLAALACQFVLPFVAMTFSYATILRRLRRRTQCKLARLEQQRAALSAEIALTAEGASADEDACERRALLERQRLRTTVILACMVLVFTLTWLPHNAVTLFVEFSATQEPFVVDDVNLIYLIMLFTHCFAMLNNVANPILYAWLNVAFRDAVKTTLGSMRIVSQPSNALEMAPMSTRAHSPEAAAPRARTR